MGWERGYRVGGVIFGGSGGRSGGLGRRASGVCIGVEGGVDGGVGVGGVGVRRFVRRADRETEVRCSSLCLSASLPLCLFVSACACAVAAASTWTHGVLLVFCFVFFSELLLIVDAYSPGCIL